MARNIALGRVETVVSELSYPLLRPDAAAELREVTVELPDGEANLGRLVSETRDDSYRSPEELLAELRETMEVDAPLTDDAEDRVV